jgi:hypothetical protein
MTAIGILRNEAVFSPIKEEPLDSPTCIKKWKDNTEVFWFINLSSQIVTSRDLNFVKSFFAFESFKTAVDPSDPDMLVGIRANPFNFKEISGLEAGIGFTSALATSAMVAEGKKFGMSTQRTLEAFPESSSSSPSSVIALYSKLIATTPLRKPSEDSHPRNYLPTGHGNLDQHVDHGPLKTPQKRSKKKKTSGKKARSRTRSVTPNPARTMKYLQQLVHRAYHDYKLQKATGLTALEEKFKPYHRHQRRLSDSTCIKMSFMDGHTKIPFFSASKPSKH